jgi:hypothetical protein
MVLVGVSIEDNTAGNYDVYAIDLSKGSNKVSIVNDIVPANKAGNADIEGLATKGSSTVFGVTESDDFANLLYTDVTDNGNNAKLSGGRLGDDSGADFKGDTLYNIQGIGDADYQLYKIVGTKVTAVGNTNTKEFADGLAIPNANSKFGYASDFDNGDGDNAELYKIDLSNGKILDTQKINTPAGFTFDQDSGLDFAPNGKLYAIADGTEDLYEVTNFGKSGDANLVLINKGLPPAVGKDGEFEGLAIADIKVSFASSSSALFNNEAGQDVLTAAFATMFDSDAVASV